MSTAKEIALYVVFMILLCFVCYGSRTKHGFLMNNALKQEFDEFDEVTDDNSFYEWLDNTLIPGLYATSWYNQRVVTNKAYINDKWSILLGMPRMRQLRVQKGHCTIPDYFRSTILRCVTSYSMDKEYTRRLNYPGWAQAAPRSYANQTLTPETCPKPWKYHTSDEITSLPYWGLQHIYGGGGYVANLGYQPDIASRVIKELSSSKWLDPRSSAVLIIFSVFNVNTEYASFLSLLYERLPTGSGLTSQKIHSVPLYSSTVSFLVFQLLFLLFVLFYFVLVCVRMSKLKCSFFKDTWNCLDVLLVVLSVGTVALQFAKGLYTSDVIRQIKANPYEDLSFDYVVMAIDVEETLIALLVFASTLKLLKLIKLDVRILLITSTMGISVKDLVPFSIIFTVILLAYAQLGILLFGTEDAAFSNLYNALSTELQMVIGGGSDLWILQKKNRVLAPFYIATFMVFMGFILINMFIAILYEAQKNQEKRLSAMEEEFEFLDFFKQKVASFFQIKKAKVEDSPNRPVSAYAPTLTLSEDNMRKESVPFVDNNRNESKLHVPENNLREQNAQRPNKKTNLSPRKKKHYRTALKRSQDDQRKSEESIVHIHERIKKMTFLLDMMEMELTGEDMQMTQMVLKLESKRGTSVSSLSQPVSSSTPVDNNRRESTITLSNLAFTEVELENEEELQLVFPRRPSQTSMNTRFRPVVMRRMNAAKFVNELQEIKEKKSSEHNC